MFVKPKTSFQKLLDKKPLRTAAYGDSKGLKLFKKFKLGQHWQGCKPPSLTGDGGYFPASSLSLYITSFGYTSPNFVLATCSMYSLVFTYFLYSSSSFLRASSVSSSD